MEQSTHRYTEAPKSTYYYRNEFQVECPKCSSSALVTFSDGYYLEGCRLTCSSCKYSQKAEELFRYNVSVSRYCDNCGKHFDKNIPNSKSKVNELTTQCPHCDVTRTFEPRNEEVMVQYNSKGDVFDPVFNLPLWFQTSVRGNLFWAKNREHLNDIRLYVEAKLRERRTTYFTTMVERLPNFIKAAKNRDDVLKAINRLLKK